jgi:hypothetical protein
LPQGVPAAQDLYRRVLARLATETGYAVGADAVQRPDGVTIPLDPAQPLLTLGRLVQEDLCLREAAGNEHVLTGAILCFPASWTLAQKIGRPLSDIHIPVPSYDAGIARRVQRMFDAIRPEQPLWRANALLYDDPTLFQPRPQLYSRLGLLVLQPAFLPTARQRLSSQAHPHHLSCFRPRTFRHSTQRNCRPSPAS